MKSKGRVSTWTTSANCEDDEARMAKNPKGESELQGFKALGFKLVYKGNDIERGIHDYEAGTIDGRGLNKYGLVQSRFGLLHGGVVERMAQQVTPAIRRDAVHHFRAFRASLSIRIKEPKKAKSKLDAGNQQMLATSGFYRIGRRLTAYESVDACPHRLASSPS